MKNYTIIPISSPKGFAIKDENGNTVGFVLNEATANVFAHVPELLEFLDACLHEPVFPHYEAVNLHEKLRIFRK